MNEAWKEDMLLRPVCSQDATPQPATFCFSVFLCSRAVGERAHRRMRQFLRCACNIFINPGWHTSSLHIISITVTFGMWTRCKDRWGVKICEIFTPVIYLLIFPQIVVVKPVWVESLQKANACALQSSPDLILYRFLQWTWRIMPRNKRAPFTSTAMQMFWIWPTLCHAKEHTQSLVFVERENLCEFALRDTSRVCQVDLLGEI